MKVEILFTAWNRRAFTEVSFELLKRNTDWSKVSRLVVYDDGSTDGTRRYLAKAGKDIEVPAFELRDGGWHSTGATMNDFVALTEAEAFVKVDNDIAMPPGWLERVTAAWYRNQEYELVGMEAAWNGAYQGKQPPNRYAIVPARHIGGVGLMRTDAFTHRRAVPLSLGKNGRAGFTIWQHRHHPRAGWLNPDVPNVQLDKIPDEPWATLSRQYVEEGWARSWDPYLPDMKGWWEWLPDDLMPKLSRRKRSSSSPT
jgi:glycosyltransferase involved in cell wall biosynthesis